MPAPYHAELAEGPEGFAAYWAQTSDGMRVRASACACGSRGTVIVFPGRTEFAEKYGQVFHRLAELDVSIATIDWRGQGLSDRYEASPTLGHVEDFRDYQRDVEALLSVDAVRQLPRPWVLLGHSMGACIGLRTLLERADFSGAIFSAPMWHLQMRAATREISSKMTQLANFIGLGSRLTPGATAGPTSLNIAFEANPLTSDSDVFAWCARQIMAQPELAIGGPSIQWTYAALEEMARLYVAPLPKVPVLTFLGTEETVVSTSVIRTQMRKMENGELVILDGARHEILMERPDILVQVWPRVAEFLSVAFDEGNGSAAVRVSR